MDKSLGYSCNAQSCLSICIKLRYGFSRVNSSEGFVRDQVNSWRSMCNLVGSLTSAKLTHVLTQFSTSGCSCARETTCFCANILWSETKFELPSSISFSCTQTPHTHFRSIILHRLFHLSQHSLCSLPSWPHLCHFHGVYKCTAYCSIYSCGIFQNVTNELYHKHSNTPSF